MYPRYVSFMVILREMGRGITTAGIDQKYEHLSGGKKVSRWPARAPFGTNTGSVEETWPLIIGYTSKRPLFIADQSQTLKKRFEEVGRERERERMREKCDDQAKEK